MSEFGNETTTATLRLGEKGIELLLKLLRYLMENHKQKYDEQIKKEQLKQLKNETKREDAVNYLNEHRGLVAMKKLERSGEKLMPIAMEMTPAQLKEFNKYARMEGVTYAVVSNKKVLNEIKLVKSQIKELEKKESLSPVEQEKYDALNRRLQELNKQKENRIVIIREKDLELVAEITERMNQNIKFENIEQEMKAYENVGIENLSPEDKKRYQDLQNEKEEMKETEFDSFNDKNNDKILAGSAEQPAWEEMNFDRALSRVTDRKFAEGNCYVCDRSNPDNYMEVSSKREQSKDGTYFTNTEYCSSKECKFSIRKDNLLFKMRTGKNLTNTQLKKLVAGEQIEVKCVSKTNTTYKGIFSVKKNDKGYADLVFTMPSNKKSAGKRNPFAPK